MGCDESDYRTDSLPVALHRDIPLCGQMGLETARFVLCLSLFNVHSGQMSCDALFLSRDVELDQGLRCLRLHLKGYGKQA